MSLLTKPNIFRFFLLAALLVLAIYVLLIRTRIISLPQTQPSISSPETSPTILNAILLPTPTKASKVALEQALDRRRDRRDFQDKSIELKALSQLLWAAQGINTDWGDRTVYSYKSSHPLTVFVIAKKINGLEVGSYQYLPGDLKPAHQLLPLTHTISQSDLDTAIALQPAKTAPLLLVITGSSTKLAGALPAESVTQYLYMEAGQSVQNISLQAEALGLGTTPIFSFNPTLLSKLVNTPSGLTPLVVLPIGYPEL